MKCYHNNQIHNLSNIEVFCPSQSHKLNDILELLIFYKIVYVILFEWIEEIKIILEYIFESISFVMSEIYILIRLNFKLPHNYSFPFFFPLINS